MKTKLCLALLLLSQCLHAELFDFNDIAVGTEVSSLNPYGAAVIGTRLWVTERESGALVAESFARGVIGEFGLSPSVIVEAGPTDVPGGSPTSRWNVEIVVSFQAPISTFSVDAYSRTYTSRLFYTGVDEMLRPFTYCAGVLGGFVDDFDHFDIAAPPGGYITGFHFSQYEDVGSIVLAMDNLDYTAVPENIGLPTFAFTICAMLVMYRRISAART